MAVEQFYYTSWDNKAPGGYAGFQVRGLSPGLAADDQQLLNDLIAFRIPSKLDTTPINMHPVALRYKYLSPRKSVLLCCQSNGTDELGRNGNFFAHALVLAPDPFTHVPPVLYWRSPFWRTRDDTPGTHIPALPSFDLDPSLDTQRIWSFLAEDGRAQWFYKLMCGVIHSARTHGRVVIVDTPDHVALWTAAVSIMLPSRYRPLLSFATYHHDPYRADYLVIGTPPDSDFHGTPADFLSFFVLDTQTGRTSEVEDSLFARTAADATRPDIYERRMLAVLNLCDRRFPAADQIDEQLDLIIRYDQMMAAPRHPSAGPADLEAIGIVLEGFDHLSTIRGDDLEDLRQLASALTQIVNEQPSTEVIRRYQRVLQLLRASDPNTAQQLLPQTLALGSRLLVGGQLAPGQAVWDLAHQVYGESALVAGLNTAAYLGALSSDSNSASPAALMAIWRSIGRDLLPRPESQSVLVNGLRRAGGAGGQMTAEGEQTIGAIAQATSAHARDWLALATQHADAMPPAALDAYYYALVGAQPLNDRIPYRQVLLPKRPTIALYEVQHDLENAGAENALAILERWARHAQAGAPGVANWMHQSLSTLQRRAFAAQWSALATKILLSASLRPYLGPQWEDQLLHRALEPILLGQPSQLDIELCQQYRNASSLNENERSLIVGVLAMSNGQLDPQAAMQLRGRFGQLSAEQYTAETSDFIARFFDQQVTRESHAQMVIATYNWTHRDLFWTSYWQTFVNMACVPQLAPRIVDLLGFWFDNSLSILGQYPYIVQSFFIALPRAFEIAQKGKGYRDAAREIERLGSQHAWYALVRDVVAPERRGILGVFKG